MRTVHCTVVVFWAALCCWWGCGARVLLASAPCRYLEDCPDGYNCLEGSCSEAATSCAALSATMPTAVDGLYWIGSDAATAVRTYCDMVLGSPLCSTVTASRSGRVRDGSNLGVSFISELNSDGICEIWKLRGTSTGYPLQYPYRDPCAMLGFPSVHSYHSCGFGTLYSNCGFTSGYYLHGVTCQGCVLNSGTFSSYVVMGPIQQMVCMTDASGSRRNRCRTRLACTVGYDCNGHATSCSGYRPNCSCVCKHGFFGTRCEATASASPSVDASGTHSAPTRSPTVSASSTPDPQTGSASVTISLMLTVSADSATPTITQTEVVSHSVATATATTSYSVTVGNNTHSTSASPTQSLTPSQSRRSPSCALSTSGTTSSSSTQSMATRTMAVSLSSSDCSLWAPFSLRPMARERVENTSLRTIAAEALRIHASVVGGGVATPDARVVASSSYLGVPVKEWHAVPPRPLLMEVEGGDPWHVDPSVYLDGGTQLSLRASLRLPMNGSVAIGLLPANDSWPRSQTVFRTERRTVEVTLTCAVVRRTAVSLVDVVGEGLPFYDETRAAVRVGVVLTSLGGGGTPSAMASVATLAVLVACGTFSDRDNGILGFSVGEDTLSDVRGAVVGNAIAVVGVLTVVFVFAVFRALSIPPRRMSLTQMLVRLHMPSLLYPVAMATAPSTLIGAFYLLAATDSAGARSDDAVAIVVGFGPHAAVWVYLVARFARSPHAEHVESTPFEDPAEGSRCTSSPPAATGLLSYYCSRCSAVRNAVNRVTRRSFKWQLKRPSIKASDARTAVWAWYAAHQILLMDVRWVVFAMWDAAVAYVSILICAVAVVVGTEVSCIAGTAAVLLVSAVHLAVLLHLRPKSAVMDQVSATVAQLLTVLVLLALLVYLCTFNDAWMTVATLLELVLACLAVLEGIRSVVGLLVAIWQLRLPLSPATPRVPPERLEEDPMDDIRGWDALASGVDEAAGEVPTPSHAGDSDDPTKMEREAAELDDDDGLYDLSPTAVGLNLLDPQLPSSTALAMAYQDGMTDPAAYNYSELCDINDLLDEAPAGSGPDD